MKDTRTITIQVVPPTAWSASRIAYNVIFNLSQLAVVGIGVLVGSAAMQWLGVLVWFLMLFALGAILAEKRKGLTVDEARKQLDDIEAGRVL